MQGLGPRRTQLLASRGVGLKRRQAGGQGLRIPWSCQDTVLRPSHQPGSAGAGDVTDDHRLGIAHGLEENQAKGLGTFQGGQTDQVATGQEGGDLGLRTVTGEADAVADSKGLDKTLQARSVLTAAEDQVARRGGWR